MRQPFRLGIIGTGVAARELHWPTLRQMPDRYQIVAVANRTRAKADTFAEMIGLDSGAVYADYRDLLARGNVDVVDLALPPQLNYEVARAAAEAGIHVICEKPIAITMAEARAMAALVAEFRVQVLIAENFRYDAAVQKARELIASGRIDPPFMLSYQYTQPVPAGDEIASRPWRQQPLHAGGCLSDHGVHMVDTVRYLMGEVAAIQVFAQERKAYLAGLDTAVYNLKFESGAIGSIQWSFSVASDQRSLIQLWSDKATLQVTPAEIRLQQPDQPDTFFPMAGPTSFENEFTDFYEALANGKKPLMTVHDALKDLEVTLAAHQSAVSGKVVALNKDEKR